MLAQIWNNSSITFASEDFSISKYDIPKGYVNATQMCKANDKKFNDYSRLKSTDAYWEALSKHTGIPVSLLVLSVEGYAEEQGTWVHPQIAIDLGIWVSPTFRVWVTSQIQTLLEIGKVELNSQPPKLYTSMERAEAVNRLAASVQVFGFEIANPRFKQAVQDLVGDMLDLTQPILTSSEPKETWLGVAERAEELGYPVSLVTNYRSQLGKYVKAIGLESKQEKRLCNGTQRQINLYLQTESLDYAIKEFTDAKVLSS